MIVIRTFPRCLCLWAVTVSCLVLNVGGGLSVRAQDPEPAVDPVEGEDATGEESMPLDYPGRAADAEWRVKAAERIEESRKADLTVTVTDSEGKAVKEAEVVAKLKRHAFLFGTKVSVAFSESEEPVVEMPVGEEFDEEARGVYREKLLALFNAAEPQEMSSGAQEKLTAWLRARGFAPEPLQANAVNIPADPLLDALTPPEELWVELEALAASEKPLVATDYALPVDVSDPEKLQLQADYTRDFFTVLFSHPQVREISIAGFWAPTSSVRGWALFDEPWTVRPVGQTFIDLTTKVWSTNETALTDAAGQVKIRGFLGEYRISVSSGAQTQSVTVELTEEGAEVAIKLD